MSSLTREHKIIEFPQLPSFDAYWGVCPKCKGHDGFVDVDHGENWVVCHRHRVKWLVGENLFSGWKRSIIEDPEGYRRHGERIAGYRKITCSQAHDEAVAADLLCAECSNTGMGSEGEPCLAPIHRQGQGVLFEIGEVFPT